jgi:hypothetical protein
MKTDKPMVVVEWHDSGLSFAMSWDNEPNLVEKIKKWDGSCTTVGYLMYEDERCVAIVLTHDDNEEVEGPPLWSQVMLISRTNMKSIHTLDLGSPRPLAFAPATTSEEPSATPEEPTQPAARRFAHLGLGRDGTIGSFCPAHVRYEIKGTHTPLEPWEAHVVERMLS